ncbi:aspartyl beta-hydroxylase [Caulobacter sp. CCG-8]|uniref:aspartyl beta-hydroxylase n=1 Tax=Caulobacter sp. CCG-8 TaxID=3127958 RepID=UPI00307E26CD
MTTGLEALRDLILDDAALSQALDAIADPEAFAARAAEAARAAGLPVEADEVRAAVRTASIPPAERAIAPPGWLPAEVSDLDGRTVVGWRWFGPRRLTAPFYADDLMEAGYRPLNRLARLQTPLPGPAERSARPPDGLVFHMSRCGSTLAAQMLAAAPANVVISEAPPIDAVLRLAIEDDAKVAALRAMVAALGQARAGETRLFVKLDCWHVRDLPLFRRAFPDTPWVFVYREPVEVLVSHLRRRGVQMIPELVPSARLGLATPATPDADYCAQVLAALCEAAARHYPAGGGRLVNHADLPEALFTAILPGFGVALSDDETTAMRAAGARDAKAPGQDYVPDGEAKRREAADDLRAISERRVGDAYRRLEALRADQP